MVRSMQGNADRAADQLRTALTHIDAAISELEKMRTSVRATGRILAITGPEQAHRPRTRLPAGRSEPLSAHSDAPSAA